MQHQLLWCMYMSQPTLYCCAHGGPSCISRHNRWVKIINNLLTKQLSHFPLQVALDLTSMIVQASPSPIFFVHSRDKLHSS